MEQENINISLKEFVEDNRIDIMVVLDNSEICKQINDPFYVGSLRQRKFGEIKTIIQKYEKGLTFVQVIREYYRLAFTPFDYSIGVIDAYQIRNWMISEVSSIIRLEEKLHGETKSEYIQAGIEMFSILGVYQQLRDLAGHDVLKVMEIENTTYELCYLELLARRLDNQFESNLSEIYKSKSNTNE